MKYLIVGLGNPGDKYENTRHNVGFKVLEDLIKETETKFEVAKLGNIAYHKFKGRTLVLLQPSTFMNLSGKAVNYWMQQEKIPLENVLIVTDDLALPLGKLRFQAGGYSSFFHQRPGGWRRSLGDAPDLITPHGQDLAVLPMPPRSRPSSAGRR